MPDSYSLSPAVEELGRALAGQYEFEGEIGRGGMGVVYLARDLKLERWVAIKALPPYLERDPDVRTRFLREARTAGALSHPNIVPIYRADELGGHVFFVMAYIDGESLAQLVRARGPLPAAEVLSSLRDIARALDYAHRHSVVHRDVKAENILIERASGHAFITDFGIARVAAAASMTATGQLLGTVAYMSPEQVMGQPLDGRADLYALGVVAYYALSGQFPFSSEVPAAVLVAHATKPAPSLRVAARGLPAGAADVVDRCLAKDPAERFATGEELARAFEEVMLGPPGPPVPVPEDARRLPSVVSETEARALWKRAAELQAAATGVRARPPESAALHFTTADARAASPTSGYRIADVVGAAREVGIGNEFVAKAAGQLGLMSGAGGHDGALGPGSALPIRSPVARSQQNIWLGGSTAIDVEARVDGEVSESELEVAVDTIQRAIGEVGVVSQLGRSLDWMCNSKNRKLHISIVVRGGQTTIWAHEKLAPLAGGVYGGVLGGVGGGVGWIGLIVGAAQFHSLVIGLGLWGAFAAGLWGIIRPIFRRVGQNRERELSQLVGHLRDYFQSQHLSGTPRLPSPAAPPSR